MKFRSHVLAMMLAGAAIASAQTLPLASAHSPAIKKPSNVSSPVQQTAIVKPAVKVNGAVLTEMDVVREMYAIFPYAQQHNGFPKDMEADIRKGATDMIIFEELVYQEAKRRNLVIPPEKLVQAQSKFRKQFASKEVYDKYLQSECSGSPQVLKEKIRRSLLIEKMFKTEIEQKSVITDSVARTYYDSNPKQFEHGETVSIQTISIIPPENPSAVIREEAKAKIKDIARLGKAAKTARDFGLIAEQISEDDWRTRMGDRGNLDIKLLPPEVTAVVRKLKIGEVSDPISVDRAWVVVRLNGHTLAGKTPFAEAKTKIKSDLQKQKKDQLRRALNQKLRKDSKIEML